MAVVATLTKGYDLDYIWRQVDRSATKDAAGYYIQASEGGGEPPGRWWGPGAQALGLEPGQLVERGPYDLLFGERKAPDGTPLGRLPGSGRNAAGIYARLLAAEPQVGSAVRRAASATAKFVNQHATGIKQVAAAVGAVAFPALAPEALAVDAPFLQQHWRGVLQTALVVGAVGLTIANVLQLGLDPLSDAAEGADVGALAAGLGEEAASTAAETGASTVEEGASSEAASGEAPAESEPGPSCGGESFTAGTKVLLASGAAIPISKLKPGDKVLATNTKTGKTSAEPVTAVLLHHDTDRYDLTVKTAHGTAVIDTTSSHLLWDVTSDRWVKAAALRHSSYLRTPSGAEVSVVGGYVPANAAGWMWDLTVPGGGDHDFYVRTSSTAVLVHNCPIDEGEPEQTVHGAERAADPSRLDPAAQAEVIANPTQTFTQADGAQVFVQQVGDRYNVVVQGERGVISNLKTISQGSLNRLARNYGWIQN